MDSDDRLLSAADLQEYMSGIGLDADQTVALQVVLDGAQRELERHCRRKFARRERTEEVEPDDEGRLWPRCTPIVSVTSPTGYQRAHGKNALVTSSGFGPSYGFDGFQPVTVTYIGGLDPDGDDLEDVKLAILRVAAREATTRHDDVLDPNDLTARRVEDRDKQKLGFQPDELAKFDRLRRRTVL